MWVQDWKIGSTMAQRRTLGPFGSGVVILGSIVAAAGCGSDPSAGEPAGQLAFTANSLALGPDRSATVTVRNGGGMAVGPVGLSAAPVAGPGGASLPGTAVRYEPNEISTLNPGESRSVTVEIDLGGSVQPGSYSTSLVASVADAGTGAASEARLPVSFEVAAHETVTGVSSVQITEPAEGLRRGDVVQIRVEARDDSGALMEGVPVGWSLDPPSGGFLGGNGQLVAYDTTPLRVVAQVGGLADTLTVTATERSWTGTLVPIGQGQETTRRTSDLWLHGDHAYLGTHTGGAGGNTLFVWDVSSPEAPVLSDSVRVDARVVNDVKVRADGRLAVITHEGSNDGANGITLLDLDDPAHPRVIGRTTAGLETGVHNAWIEGDYLYLVADGTGVGLRILDVSNPEAPVTVGSFSGSETTFLHDVYVRDGLAFLSHWNAGLIVLDVGHGMAGGSPAAPVEVSRIETSGGQTHNAWYWPAAGYVFVGEEDTSTPGVMHVVDFRDPSRPVEVATFALPEHTPHNFWLDEDRGVLFMAWYGQGLRALDVNGELLGELDRQGREVASVHHQGPASCGFPGTCTWAPQLHRGRIFVSDMGFGLTVLDPIL